MFGFSCSASRVVGSALASRLSRLGPVLVTIREFEYAGDNLRAKGTLAAVSARVPQEPLPPALGAALVAELDTRGALVKLLRILETAAHVVGNGFGGQGSGGAGGLNPRTPLTAFVEGTLRVGPAVWAAACPAAVGRAATLGHLRALIVAVEAGGLGHAAANHAVADKFRAPLPADHLAALKRALARLADAPSGAPASEGGGGGRGAPGGAEQRASAGGDLAAVLGPFRDLLSGPLAEPSAFGAGESLKLFLTYQDDDLAGESTWFARHFPEDLLLASALEAYLALAAAGDHARENGRLRAL